MFRYYQFVVFPPRSARRGAGSETLLCPTTSAIPFHGNRYCYTTLIALLALCIYQTNVVQEWNCDRRRPFNHAFIHPIGLNELFVIAIPLTERSKAIRYLSPLI